MTLAFKKMWKKRWILRSIFHSIVFNFKHLPLRQACKLPILLYKPRILSGKGKFIFRCPVKFGLVKLGAYNVSIYPNSGIMVQNAGTMIFNGRLSIGNASAISVGKTGTLEFGDDVVATTSLKLVCYDSVHIQDGVLIGWNCMITDTDFHKLKYVNKMEGGGSKGHGKISIGHHSWIANGCKLYKNAIIPAECVVGADTIIHGPIKCAPHSLITNEINTVVHSKGIYLDRTDDKIDYEQ